MRHRKLGLALAVSALGIGVASANTFSYRNGDQTVRLEPIDGVAIVKSDGFQAPVFDQALVSPYAPGYWRVEDARYSGVALADRLRERTGWFTSPLFRPSSGPTHEFSLKPHVVYRRTDQAGRRSVSAIGSSLVEVSGTREVSREVFPGLAQAFLKTNQFRDVLTVANEFAQRSDLSYALPGYFVKVKKMADFNDPGWASQWYKNYTGQFGGDPRFFVDIELERAFDITTGNRNVQVLILDDGIDLTHPEFNFGDTFDTTTIFGGTGQHRLPGEGHGTLVASIVGSIGNNGQGLVGISPNVRVAAVRCLIGDLFDPLYAADALAWAAPRGIRLTVMALATIQDAALDDAFNRTRIQNGMTHFASIGQAEISYPASLGSVIGVKAADFQGNAFGADGDQVWVSAPGVLIPASAPGPTYGILAGPSGSAAASIAAGVAALMTSVNPGLQPAQIEELLAATATDLLDISDTQNRGVGRDNNSGYGMINAAAAVGAAGFASITAPTSIHGGQTMDVSVQTFFRPVNPLSLPIGSSHFEILPADPNFNTVQIQAGSNSGNFRVQSWGVDRDTNIAISIYYGNLRRSANVRVQRAIIDSVTVTPGAISSGQQATGRITLRGINGPTARTMTLRSSSPAATVPASVVMPGSQFPDPARRVSQVTFPITANAVTQQTPVTITITDGAQSITARVDVIPPTATLDSLTLQPTSVMGGQSTRATVSITANASAPQTIQISDNSAAILAVPNQTIATGQRSVSFNVATARVATPTTGVITARLGGQTRSATLTVTTTLQVESLTITPAQVLPGFSVTGQVVIYAPAPTGGATVALSDNSAYATTPASVVVPAGRLFANFTIRTQGPVPANQTVTVTARYGTNSRTATFVIRR